VKLRRVEITGFKSFAKKTTLSFDVPITAIVGPNGSGKSNIAEALRWVLGEQSMKSLRGKRGEDLIFNGAGSAGRLNRASVALVFDNSGKELKIDFDEVIISREVFRDGSNTYMINGSQVRLRDVIELLSGVSLGHSGHHIISQGEADRVLNANPKERREILEDALGLKIYQYKLSESSKRLEKTSENIKQVESLRREIAPHLKFLKKQVEEAEKVVAQKTELAELSREYFGHEKAYLDDLHRSLTEDSHKLKSDLGEVEKELSKIGKSPRMREITEALTRLRSDKDETSRMIGRLEGKIEGAKRVELVRVDEKGEERCRYCGQIIDRQAKPADGGSPGPDVSGLREEKEQLEIKSAGLAGSEKDMMRELDSLREAEKVSYELRAKEASFRSELEKIAISEASYKNEKEVFTRDAHEIIILTGVNVLSDSRNLVSGDFGNSVSATRDEQQDLRKKIERLKIRIEDAGGVGPDVIKEYDDTRTRDEHLSRELEDLSESKGSLEKLMQELTKTLHERFKDGLALVNKEFHNFFETLFGGGKASIEVIKIGGGIDEVGEEIESEVGIDISVNLPRKKIKGLEMLSGGERALTSIALLFAMSQVNPPPFLVLDETDAALDEANARKYGQMLKQLSSKSQLIVVTHNRETMSHSSVLYGVTMLNDGISKLLSIKFDEASEYAK